jgi:hypothetical protein
MTNPTSSFGWQMPTNVDLVTDLPADFEVFGQAVDTSMADLLGGTTGQILAKNSNTNMDFVWVTNDVGDITGVTAGTGISGGGTSGTVTVTNSMATAIDAKGDLIAGTGADAFSRLAVGTDAFFLQAASGQATGLQWGGTYTSYTPTLQSITIGNGTVVGSYLQIGKFVHGVITLTLGSTSSVATFPRFSFPVAAATQSVAQIGFATFTDAGTQNYWGTVNWEDANTLQVYVQDTSGAYSQRGFVGATTPFTWATNDIMLLNFYYKAA